MKIHKLFFRIFILILFLLFMVWVILFCRIFIASFSSEAQKADSIIVLGAAQWDGQPSPIFQARLDHAYDLYEKVYSSKIILTGGIGEGDIISEAEVGAQYLSDRGVLSNALIIDPYGSTTFESLNNIADKIGQNNINSVILVSHDFHNF